MKRKLIFLFGFFPLLSLYSQVGINNENPKATLHITPGKTDGSTPEGIIAPNLSRAQLITKDVQYTAAQKGAIVYVSTIDGTVSTKTIKVTSIGYYYFDGSIWQQFATSAAGSIPSEPWRVQGSTTEATSNAQHIYQTGKVAIGTGSTAASAYNLDVAGTSNISGNSRVGSSTVVGAQTVGTSLAVTGTTHLTGKVGIGRAPAAGNYIVATTGDTYQEGMLEVVGDEKISGTLTVSSTGSFVLAGNGVGSGKYLVSDANGKGTWTNLPPYPTIPTTFKEPWLVQGSTTQATTNAQNIYQTGSVAIGTGATAASGYKLDVAGTSNVSGNSRVGSSTVVGSQTVGTTLAVTGATTLSNALTVAGATTLNGTTTTKATTITGQLNYKPTATNPVANTYLRTDAAGNATWQSLPATATTEPWQVQGGATLATSNAQNIYQTGSVHIGANTAVPAAYKLQVTGASNVTGNSRVGSSTVVGAQTVGTTLAVTGATTLSNALTVAGATTLNGTTTTKATTITGQLNYKPTAANPVANTYLRTDAAGNATWQSLPATATTEPWQVQGGATLATSNAQNIYQTGSVHIGANTAVPAAYKLQVTGASNITGNSRVGSSTVVGAQTVGTTLAVTGATTLNSTLTTVGTSALRGSTTIGTTTAAANLVVNGNTGIGIASPTQKLDVRGNEFVSGISKVGGTTTLNSSAQLELADANKGFLPNRVALTSSTVKAPVTNAVDGMMVYNTATVAAESLAPGFYYWRANRWNRLVDEIPKTSIKMYYQTASVVGGSAAGHDQSKMVSMKFSPTGTVHAPSVLKLPEDGSYAFNVKLYSMICNSTTGALKVPAKSGKSVVYVGIWVNGVLQDVSEIFLQIGNFANGTTTISGNNLTNVVLGCSGKEGDIIDIRLGYYATSLSAGEGILSQGFVSATPRSDRTSMIFWKL
jgi:hypothetical protein